VFGLLVFTFDTLIALSTIVIAKLVELAYKLLLIAGRKLMLSYTEKDKALVWSMAKIVPGYDQNEYRKDRCGAWIAWINFGDRNADYGWEIDHIVPVSKGGRTHVTNVQPLHWKNNASKSDGPLVCAIGAV
jgi:hypothetical protein